MQMDVGRRNRICLHLPLSLLTSFSAARVLMLLDNCEVGAMDGRWWGLVLSLAINVVSMGVLARKWDDRVGRLPADAMLDFGVRALVPVSMYGFGAALLSLAASEMFGVREACSAPHVFACKMAYWLFVEVVGVVGWEQYVRYSLPETKTKD